jgi:hypothetical protein
MIDKIPDLLLTTMPSGSTRFTVTFLYSLPSIVLKSSASAIDADSAAKIASAVLFIAPALSQFPRGCRS